jgi:hypothetical protein
MFLLNLLVFKYVYTSQSFECVKQFKYLLKTLTNQHVIHEEIKNRVKSGNAYYHSVYNLLFCNLL